MVEKSLTEFKNVYDMWAAHDMLDRSHPVLNLSLRYGCIDIYIRNMARGICDGKPVVCIANVSITDKFQNKGLFTAIINYIKENPQQFFVLEVELVHTKYLRASLEKQGFKPGTQGHDKITFVHNLKN